jgi:hypothetical protein
MKKRNYTIASKKEKMRYLRSLELNNMNFSLTGRQLGISRQTLKRYHDVLWREYQEQKKSVFAESIDLEAKKLAIVKNIDDNVKKLNLTLDLTITIVEERLKDPEEVKKIPTKDLVNLINVLSPYLVEKRATAGIKTADENDSKSQHTTFIQNIIAQMNARGEKMMADSRLKNTENIDE